MANLLSLLLMRWKHGMMTIQGWPPGGGRVMLASNILPVLRARLPPFVQPPWRHVLTLKGVK